MAKGAPTTVSLREDLARGLLPLAEGKPRVDRTAGIIYGVKVVGRDSPNTHGVRGVSGTDYTLQALREALPLYEGLAVNIDHPPKREPGAERSSEDRLGKLVGARVAGGEVYADLHLLLSHPMAARLMEAAEKMPEAFALSHNATGKGEARGGRYVITEIPEVRSVDVVADGGSNRSLFEGSQRPVKITLRKLVESAPKGKYPRLRKLLELYEEAGDMETTAPEGGGGGMDDMDDADHLFQAFKKCLETDPGKAKKILALLKPGKDVEEGDESEEDGKDEDPKEDESAGKGKKEEEKKATEESRKRRVTRLAKGFLNLREAEQPPPKLIEALVCLPTEESRLSLLESWPTGQPAGATGGSAPRSAGPGGGRPLQESAAARSADDLATMLLRS